MNPLLMMALASLPPRTPIVPPNSAVPFRWLPMPWTNRTDPDVIHYGAQEMARITAGRLGSGKFIE